MRRLLAACVAALATLAPTTAWGETPPPELGSDDPGIKQRVAADEAVATDEVAIDAGHVDLGPRIIDDEWTLLMRDDTARLEGGAARWRRPDRTVLRVRDTARTTLPDGDDYAFTGAKAGEQVWAVPQTEVTDVVWLGWNTQDPAVVDSTERGVTLEFEGVTHVEGGGRMSLFLQPGNFAPPQLLFDGKSPGDVWVDLNTHTHANWVFTKPGTYLVRTAVTATGTDGAERRAEAVLRFAVGDATDWHDALAAEAPTPSPSASASPAASASSAPSPDAGAAAAGPDGGAAVPVWAWVAGGVGVVAVAVGVPVAVRNRRRMEQEVFGDDE
ncbi:choice-of-anchor M domain-containing protein [uncultured Tessaracoccus sp.]|uniref:choice-of-anchor M domain-containing protein n=1 Tax=uncultured Tessaracoccus sp. TaxID=905023 RepID=UPI0025EDE650|nr:choice-of-anchor M domain-containing protein [uncultured Tessaracoccus sp.]